MTPTSHERTLSDTIVLNGLQSGKGGYALTCTLQDLVQLAAQKDPSLRGNSRYLKGLRVKKLAKEQGPTFAMLQAGKDPNNLKDAGWAVIFPAETQMPVEAVRQALAPLLEHRRKQAGDLYLECVGVAGGVRRGESANQFMQRYKSAPGVVRPRPKSLPYYLLLVGSPQEIPFRFQYELDATFLVGRICFDTVEAYYQYARSVVEAETNPPRLERRAVFFGPRHAGDPATESSAAQLVKPLANELSARFKQATSLGWKIEAPDPSDCTLSRLEGLLGKQDAPSLLFTASHGMVFDSSDPLQKAWQGALVCQDLPSIHAPADSNHYLGAEHIASDFSLHGLIAFHFACFGAGTPKRDNFAVLGTFPDPLAPADFLSALPLKLLSHPRGGALGVVGHVDRAWPYSFMWGEAGAQIETFTDTLYRLMAGETLGNALDSFNTRYAQIAVTLANMLDKSQVSKPDPFDLVEKWIANNDARGYALLGDPAVRLALPKAGEAAQARQALELVSFAGEAAAPEPAITPAGDPEAQAAAPQEISATTAGATIIHHNAAGVTINHIYAALPPGGRLPEGMASFGGVGGWFTPRGAEEDEAPAKPGPFDEAVGKLKAFASTLAEKAEDFASDAASLEVTTYVSSDLENVTVEKGKFSGKLTPRARTLIRLDGDTEIVVPSKGAGELSQQALWEIHAHTVQQAVETRAAMFKALGDLITGLVRGGS